MRTDSGLVPGQFWLSDLDFGDIAISQGLDIANGRLAEEATVLAAELAHTLVADLVRSACGIEAIHQHSLTRGLEPQLFLILQRAHCGKRAELMVQSRMWRRNVFSKPVEKADRVHSCRL
jgi:hypothetical protein